MEDQTTVSPAPEVVTDLKTTLLPYKQVIPTLYNYFTWKKQFYPAVIVAEVTLTYLSIWFFETSVLTVVSLLAAAFVLLDYFLPLVLSSFFDASKWTEEDDRKYDEVCEILSAYWNAFNARYEHWSELRKTKSKVYYVTVLSSLLLLAWLGGCLPGFFFSYVLTLGLAMFPGLKHHQGACMQVLDRGIKLIKGLITKEKKED